MFSPPLIQKALAWVVIVLTLALPALGQDASEPPQPQAAAPPSEVIKVGRIPSRYEDLDKRLATMRKGLGGA